VPCLPGLSPDLRLLAREFAGAAWFVWVDIEDDEDALGTVEVDDFPTLLIARAGQICHFAAVMPSAPTGRRLVRRALAGEPAPLGVAHSRGPPRTAPSGPSAAKLNRAYC
jgi:hypothetical protein